MGWITLIQFGNIIAYALWVCYNARKAYFRFCGFYLLKPYLQTGKEIFRCLPVYDSKENSCFYSHKTKAGVFGKIRS
jgi:hypothetical protein